MQPKYLTWKERRSVRGEIKGWWGGGAHGCWMVCVCVCVRGSARVCWDGDETYSAE